MSRQKPAPGVGDEISLKSTPKSFNDQETVSSGSRRGSSSRPSSQPGSRSSSPFLGLRAPSFGKLLPGKGGTSSALSGSGKRNSTGSLPPLITPKDAARSVGHCDGYGMNNGNGGLLRNNSDARDNGLHHAADVDAKPYAIHHDELVTALIDEALRNGSSGDENDDGDVEAIEVSAPAGNSEGTPQRGKKKTSSPYRMKRNISMQLGNSPVVGKLRKRQRSESGEYGKKSSSPTPLVSSHISKSAGPLKASASSTGSTASTTNPADYFHPDCILQKEKADKQTPKLSFGMNSSNRSGNHVDHPPSAVGRTDTLIKLQKKLSMLGEIESGKYGRAAEMLRSDAVAFALRGTGGDGNNKPALAKVETRSILTLRMGFVSMSYGILLQWDCASRLVELIVLRKMCREDFLKRSENKGTPSSSPVGRDSHHSTTSNGRRSSSTSAKPPLVPPKPDLIPVPKTDRRAESEKVTSSDRDLPENQLHGRLGLPKLHLPHNPLAGIPKLLNNALHSPSSRPQSFLSVSVLNVKKLHGGCEHCRKPVAVGGGIWSSITGRQPPPPTAKGTPRHRPQRIGERKRKHTIRPYVRFVLGRHEHCTKITKFSDGNPAWTRRHHNSCLLPCPPEEIRWFAGREDLIVEVRNNWKSPSNSSGKASNHHAHKGLFGGKHSEETMHDHTGDPILAVVTVPLSSVNIEDDEGGGQESDAEGGTFQRRITRDGASSTDITIPLRMSCCNHAPIGSISLKITIKVPSRGDGSTVPSTLARPNIQVDISVSGDGGNGEPKVNESIELGPLTRLMDGWALGSGSREPSVSKEDKESTPTTAATSSSNSPGDTSPARSVRSKMKRKRLRWSKQFDHRTKKWSTLRPSTNGSTPMMSLTIDSKANDDESANNGNDGWFTFLNR